MVRFRLYHLYITHIDLKARHAMDTKNESNMVPPPLLTIRYIGVYWMSLISGFPGEGTIDARIDG